jgi:hypothetical protein
MFRYSRDVKRCGPGTKAGAPVGVVYCLSTSSFFILTLTLGLDVSAYGNGDRPRNIFAAILAGRQYGPLGPSLQAGSLRSHGPCYGDGSVKFSRDAAQPGCARLLDEVGVAHQTFLVSMAARASAKLARIRSRMILGASVLDFWTSSATSLVFLTVASNMRLANSACLVMTS